jgi:NTP pyrophosphatase (non-canonical NTP hydrolase)
MDSISRYQREAYRYAAYAHAEYPFLALSEEVGEVMGKLAKYVRKHKEDVNCAIAHIKRAETAHHSLARDALKAELGDVMWNLSACCTELGFDLGDVLQSNLYKLASREQRDCIVGEGDHR